ncbi:hypothetical protein LSAT2_016733 [Lamellibrachia satsuma]|nr:hypothetical protein LSAT2_016733 [Lamellibrachia satsuma]
MYNGWLHEASTPRGHPSPKQCYHKRLSVQVTTDEFDINVPQHDNINVRRLCRRRRRCRGWQPRTGEDRQNAVCHMQTTMCRRVDHMQGGKR